MIEVSFRCEVCGAGLEWPDDATYTKSIICKNCGTNCGTYGDFRDSAEAAAEIDAILEGKRSVQSNVDDMCHDDKNSAFA